MTSVARKVTRQADAKATPVAVATLYTSNDAFMTWSNGDTRNVACVLLRLLTDTRVFVAAVRPMSVSVMVTAPHKLVHATTVRLYTPRLSCLHREEVRRGFVNGRRPRARRTQAGGLASGCRAEGRTVVRHPVPRHGPRHVATQHCDPEHDSSVSSSTTRYGDQRQRHVGVQLSPASALLVASTTRAAEKWARRVFHIAWRIFR